MKIYEVLQININKKGVLSFVGGGGKTTSIFNLAEELTKEDKKVLISTTTKMFKPNRQEYDYCFLEDIKEEFIPQKASITILGHSVKNKKLIGVLPEILDKIVNKNIFDFILIEADGAKRKAIKAPNKDEPVIAKTTTLTIGIIGFDCINKDIDEKTVHRPELFKKISGNENLKIIDENCIVNLVLDKKGLFKNSKGQKLLILNKINKEKEIHIARNIQKKLQAKGFDKIIIGDIMDKKFY